jgi:hypothetical protein
VTKTVVIIKSEYEFANKLVYNGLSNPPTKRPKRFNLVGAMENLGKEFVREAGEMAPETMADNLMPVLTHLLPGQEEQKRWC